MTWGLILMSLLYGFAGLGHFAKPKVFEEMIPAYLPAHRLLVYLSGLAEITLAAALWVPDLRRWAAWGVIALLVAVFPANLNMAMRGGKAYGVPGWTLWARLPLQGVLIAWAYTYA